MNQGTRDKLLRAATQLFAEKGFSGARVDEIARRAKANKAMIYYHFGPKVDLYQAVLLHLFGRVVEVVDRVEAEVPDPRERLSVFYRQLAQLFGREPALPAIMTREALEGGRHMAPQTAQVLTRIVGFVSCAVETGAASGRLRPVHPLALHLSMIGPLLFFFIGETFRNRVLAPAAPNMAPLDTGAFLDFLDHLLGRGLAPANDGAAFEAAPARQETV
jgi:AcrR family transcriptional regulator